MTVRTKRCSWHVPVGMACCLLVSCGEWKEVEVETGFRGEARRNPFLALERFCVEMGTPAQSVASYLEPPPIDVLLWTTAQSVAYGGNNTAEFLDWVERGGNAVLHGFEVDGGSPGLGATSSDRLLQALRVRCRTGPVAGKGPGSEGVSFQSFDPESVRKVWDAPVAAMAVRWGEGVITLVAASWPYENEFVGSEGHAATWWEYLRRSGDPAGVQLVVGEDPSLLSLLLQSGWPVAIGLCLAVALWVWRGAARFGPLVAEPSTARRAFAEHITASGRFQWRHREGAALLGAVRRSFLRRLQRRRPDLAAMDEAALAKAWTARNSMDEASCRAALSGSTADAADFTRRVQDLQRMLRTP